VGVIYLLDLQVAGLGRTAHVDAWQIPYAPMRWTATLPGLVDALSVALAEAGFQALTSNVKHHTSNHASFHLAFQRLYGQGTSVELTLPEHLDDFQSSRAKHVLLRQF
jgi:hypothetical protein